MLNVSATCSRSWVHARHLEAVAVITTGCQINIDSGGSATDETDRF